jgi:hypothetical protein
MPLPPLIISFPICTPNFGTGNWFMACIAGCVSCETCDMPPGDVGWIVVGT